MKLKSGLSLLMLAFMAASLLSCNQSNEKNQTKLTAENTVEPAKAAQDKPADNSLLVGTWVRTDAPYNLKISEILDDGNLKAAYLNPKSINVSKAMWSNSGGGLFIYVELRDVNYPGSNYKLKYSVPKDALEGEYFQAVEGLTYNVVFTRVK